MTSFDIWLSRRPFKSWAEARAAEAFDGAMTQPMPLVRRAFKMVEKQRDHVLRQRWSGTWIVERHAGS